MMPELKQQTKTEFYNNTVNDLFTTGRLDYGSDISTKELALMFRVTMPSKKATQAEWDGYSLQFLEVVETIRAFLLNKGRFFKAGRTLCRVLSPSENMNTVDSYIKQSYRKVSRGAKLLQNTPTEYQPAGTDNALKIMRAIKNSATDARRKLDLLS